MFHCIRMSMTQKEYIQKKLQCIKKQLDTLKKIFYIKQYIQILYNILKNIYNVLISNIKCKYVVINYEYIA